MMAQTLNNKHYNLLFISVYYVYHTQITINMLLLVSHLTHADFSQNHTQLYKFQILSLKKGSVFYSRIYG